MPFKNLAFTIPALIVFILIVVGIFQLYKNNTKENPIVIASPVASPHPVATPPSSSGFSSISTQPQSGSNTQVIQNVGIYIDQPIENQKIGVPLTVSGKANVFNGSVQIRVKDANGNIIGNGSATACLGLDACPFSASVVYKKPQAANGTIEVYSPNAVDNTEDYLQSIIVQF